MPTRGENTSIVARKSNRHGVTRVPFVLAIRRVVVHARVVEELNLAKVVGGDEVPRAFKPTGATFSLHHRVFVGVERILAGFGSRHRVDVGAVASVFPHAHDWEPL